jgi:hypothetical protein
MMETKYTLMLGSQETGYKALLVINMGTYVYIHLINKGEI